MNMSTSDKKTFDLTRVTTYQAGVAQSAMHRLLQKECDEYLKEFGITKMHWLIIGTVLDAGKDGMRFTDIAEKLQTGLPYLTTTVNLLESKGILDRTTHEEDSRAKVVKINPSFEPKCADIEKSLRERLRESIYSKVSQEDFLTYMRVLYLLGGESA
jgi:DNA-binding MarR family transcriptional regulator